MTNSIKLNVNESTIAELLAIYNAEAALRKAPTIKSWKQSKQKLAEKIVALCGDAPLQPNVSVEVKAKGGTEAEPQCEENPLMKIVTAKEIAAEVAQMPEIQSGACIKDVSCQLLTAVRCVDAADGRKVGFSYASILAKIAKMFPNSTTSNACLRWYLVRIRQDVEGFDKHPMPIKFKRPKSML